MSSDCPPMKLSAAEQLESQNLYLCVLAQGRNHEGNPCYAYFGIFADQLVKLTNHLAGNSSFNPKDFGAIILARAVGEATPDIREFMRRRFSFHEEEVVLELSRPESTTSGSH
jgi:hypothetical protein